MSRNFLFLLATLLLALGCTEIPPTINPLLGGEVEPPSGDSTLQKVLIEELTGVKCVNCPGGTAEVLRLQELLGKQVIAVALHAGSFAIPYEDSRGDFRIPETASLLNYLGSPLGYPSAVINRKLYEGERDLQLSRGLWPIFTSQEIQGPATLKLEVNTIFNETSRELRVDINIDALVAINESVLKLSVMLVEDRVADVQLTPDGKNPDYLHRHNLRDMLTAFNGNSIEPNLAAGDQVSRNYFYTLPEAWLAEECAIIAFVHLDGEQKDVLQVEKAELLP